MFDFSFFWYRGFDFFVCRCRVFDFSFVGIVYSIFFRLSKSCVLFFRLSVACVCFSLVRIVSLIFSFIEIVCSIFLLSKSRI